MGYLLQSALFLGAAAWTAWARAHIAERGASWVASRLVVVTLSAMLGLMLVDPVSAGSLTVAPLVPFLLAVPYLTDGSMRRLGVACWLACTGIASMAMVAQAAGFRQSPGGLVLLLNTAIITALVLHLLWGYRERLLASGRDMARLIRLSRDVSETLDPTRVAERLARHLQETTHADACVISAYLADRGEVMSFASWPPEHAERDDEAYRLDDYPPDPTRGRGAAGRAGVVRDDPAGDPAEVADAPGRRRDILLMVPLVARGETIGLVEITRSGAAFGPADDRHSRGPRRRKRPWRSRMPDCTRSCAARPSMMG